MAASADSAPRHQPDRAPSTAQPAAASAQATTQQTKLADRLRRWGVAGVAAYGVLNTLYYSAAMCIAWFFIVKVPPGVGLQEGLRKLAEVAVSAWALSQVTKVPRAFGCAAAGIRG